MRINWYPRGRVASLDCRWRAVFGRVQRFVVPECDVLERYAVARCDGPLIFANWDQSVAGEVTLEPGEPRPALRDLCESLNLSDAVVFPQDLSWCAWVGHEDWDALRFTEASPPSGAG
jgi:hypothetical protein